MRDECDRIADVIQQFFTETEYGYSQKKAENEIIKYRDKSAKAKAAVEARWAKKPNKPHTDVLQTQYERNTNQEPRTAKHKPPTIIKRKAFSKPSQLEVDNYASECNLLLTGFHDYYESNGWKVSGKSAMKDWKASARGWSRRQHQYSSKKQPSELNFDSTGWSQ